MIDLLYALLWLFLMEIPAGELEDPVVLWLVVVLGGDEGLVVVVRD